MKIKNLSTLVPALLKSQILGYRKTKWQMKMLNYYLIGFFINGETVSYIFLM